MKILGLLFVLASAVLGVLAALDDYFATNAQIATPPVVYVSPSYIPPHADILWCVALAVGVGLIRLASGKSKTSV